MIEEAFDTVKFFERLETVRIERGLSGRALMREAGISTSGASPGLYTRLRQGYGLSLHNYVRFALWLGETDIGPYVITRKEETS
jgi:transcriptional regulator with XRE-family HTH domain